MRLFSILKALLQLIKVLNRLEQTLTAQAILQHSQLRAMNLSTGYTRKDIISPLLLELYDQWVISTSGEDTNIVVDSITNWERLRKGL